MAHAGTHVQVPAYRDITDQPRFPMRGCSCPRENPGPRRHTPALSRLTDQPRFPSHERSGGSAPRVPCAGLSGGGGGVPCPRENPGMTIDALHTRNPKWTWHGAIAGFARGCSGQHPGSQPGRGSGPPPGLSPPPFVLSEGASRPSEGRPSDEHPTRQVGAGCVLARPATFFPAWPSVSFRRSTGPPSPAVPT